MHPKEHTLHAQAYSIFRAGEVSCKRNVLSNLLYNDATESCSINQISVPVGVQQNFGTA